MRVKSNAREASDESRSLSRYIYHTEPKSWVFQLSSVGENGYRPSIALNR
jgi:hypothetical protein